MRSVSVIFRGLSGILNRGFRPVRRDFEAVLVSVALIALWIDASDFGRSWRGVSVLLS